MLSRQDNERVTRVGPGTQMGRTLRHYWVPAALSSELPEQDGPPVRVRLMGEDLLAWRDSDGVVALTGAYCPHRLAPMYFGRNEAGGLRCVYHGWKFDRTGRCTHMPTEPPHSTFPSKVRIPAYPTAEAGGIVWTYMGPPDMQPEPPDWELTRTPASHRFVSKTVQDCNWLQALEGGLDSAHAMIMHNERIGDLSFLADYDRLTPKLEVISTDYGMKYTGIREIGTTRWVRLYHFMMPFTALRGRVAPLRGAATPPRYPTMCGHLWVPMDDVTTAVYNFIYSADPAIELPLAFALHNEREDGRHPDDLQPDFRLKANASNDYFLDRRRQARENFTGIEGINTQDVAIQEGMGPIVDRTQEHLGSTDRAIIQMRRLQLEAIRTVEEGGRPKGADTASYAHVRAVDLIVPETETQMVLERESVARY